MSESVPGYLSKREQQIMEVLYRCEKATAKEVMQALPDSPGNATVRKLLRILVEKGQIEYWEEAGTFLYRPTLNRRSAAKGALDRLVQTFFGGSLHDTVATLIDPEDKNLTDEELNRLQELIEKARRRDE
jgi:BlaI family penicillinase repressor